MQVLTRALAWLLQNRPTQLVIVVVFLCSPFLIRLVDAYSYEPPIAYGAEAQNQENTSAIKRLFGEVRTSLSDYMLLKTERYLHNGVAYLNHDGISQELDEHHHEDMEKVTTLIRSPLEDWRGVIGDLQREVKPWTPSTNHMHHEPGEQLLPWYRLATLANPHRIRGYKIGAMWLLAENDDHTLEIAEKFIDEGIRNNPTSHELLYTKARILFRRKKFDEALVELRHAVEYGREARPEGGWELEGISRDKEQAFADAMHMEVLILRHLGRYDEALRRIREGLQLCPEDQVLHQLNNEISNLQTPGTPG